MEGATIDVLPSIAYHRVPGKVVRALAYARSPWLMQEIVDLSWFGPSSSILSNSLYVQLALVLCCIKYIILFVITRGDLTFSLYL